MNCQLGEVLAVHLYPGSLQAVHEATVVDSVGAADRIDANNPQLTKFTLLFAAVAVGVNLRAINCILRIAKEAGFITEVAFGFFQYFFATCKGRGSVGGSRHVFVSLVLVRRRVAHFHVTRLA